VYTVTVNFDNHAGNAWFTDIALEHSIGPHGETWVPSTTPVGVDFQVSSSTQITITNWAPDDHSDVRTSATELLPDNYALPGRMDRADDLDVFRVTADVSGTLAVRISSPGLGIMPHIRLFAGDGVTEIGEYDFTPHGKAYFVTRLEASAGETFYVEISDRQGGVGGVYYISAGKPLPFFWEKTLANIYLPLLKR
jgi:hypothetical protein